MQHTGVTMKLLTDEQVRRMTNNGKWNRERRRREGHAEDFMPVVKLFCPWSPATWLLSEIDAHDQDIAFGLCDLGFGLAEIGRVRLSALQSLRNSHGLKVERDRAFRPVTTLAGYACIAIRQRRIVA